MRNNIYMTTRPDHQLEFFPQDIRIERVDPDRNMRRFYRLRVQPDLFGGVTLFREWGRIGTGGRQMAENFRDAVGDLLMDIEFLCCAGHELSPFASLKAATVAA